ncbi:MFS transporter [Marinobacteraceae bacterium S3BR75-40.1]
MTQEVQQTEENTQNEAPCTMSYTGESHSPKTLLAGTSGNIMEWYDFALYGFLAPILSKLFFPSDNELASLIATYGVFAAGFVMRPLGGLIFGYIGDRFGRAAVLKISIGTMGAATTALGLLPTHAQAGVWATVLLVTVRMFQGLSVGGEFSGSVTYMVETSPLHRRGLSGSWANFGSMIGTLLGSSLAALVTSVMAHQQVLDWGWRMPFLFGGIMGIAAFFLVKEIGTSPHMGHHQRQHESDNPLKEVLTRNRRETILAVLFASGYGIFFYIPLVYLPSYANEVANLANDLTLQINSAGIALALPLIPLGGWLSDHLMRRRTLLILAFAVATVVAWSLFTLIDNGVWGLVAAQFAFVAILAIPLGAAPAMLVELFPVQDRLTGYSLAYNLGLGVAGGTAPMIATWLISYTGHDLAPSWYLAAATLLSAVALYLMQDRSREMLR